MFDPVRIRLMANVMCDNDSVTRGNCDVRSVTEWERWQVLPGLVLVVALAVVLAVSLVAGAGGGGEETAHIHQVEDDAEEDEGAQQGQRGGGGRGVEVEEPSLGLVHDLSAVKVWGGGHGGADKQRQQKVFGHHPRKVCGGEKWDSYHA